IGAVLLTSMSSDRVGADAMCPLATPVLAGMVSSLVYVLVVTPVLFYWINEYRLRPVSEPLTRPSFTVPRWVPAAVVLIIAIAAGGWWLRARTAVAPQPEPTGAVLPTVRAGDLAITLSNSR